MDIYGTLVISIIAMKYNARAQDFMPAAMPVSRLNVSRTEAQRLAAEHRAAVGKAATEYEYWFTVEPERM